MSWKILQLDGAAGHVTLPTAEALGLVGRSFTVEAWVRFEGWGDTPVVVGSGLRETGKGLHLCVKDQKPYFGFYSVDTAAQTTLALDTWYHLAWRYDRGTGEQAIFVDGVLDASAAGKAAFSGSGPVWIGRFVDGNFLQGQVAELRIWRTARSAEEILVSIDRRLAGDEPGLVACWPLDDGEGTAAANVKAAFPGQGFGTVSEPASPPAPGITEAFELNGTSFFAEIPHHDDVAFACTDDDFTLEVWAQAEVEAGAGESVVVEKWSGGGGFPYALRFRHETGRFVFARSNGRTPHPEVVSTDAFGDGGFHHLAAVKEGATLKLYVDGTPQGEAADTLDGTIRGSASLFVGARAGGSHFLRGQVTELRLWRRARTAAEVLADKDRRLAGDEVDLAGYWPFDDAGDGDEIVVRDGRVHAAGVLSDASWTESADLPLASAAEPEAEASDLAAQVASLEEEVAAQTEALWDAIQRREYREARKAELAAQIAGLEASWEAETAELRATLEAEVAARREVLATLGAEQRAADLEEVDALLDSMVEATHARLEKARTVLDRREGRFALRRARTNLRYVAGAGGRGALFPGVDAASDADRLSELRLEFIPGRTAPAPEVKRNLVPDVLGYTAAVARRKLRSAGYLAEVAAQAAASSGEVGKVLSQLPAAGSEAAPSTTVRVFLGKAGGANF